MNAHFMINLKFKKGYTETKYLMNIFEWQAFFYSFGSRLKFDQFRFVLDL